MLGDGSVHKVDAATGAEIVLFTESAPGRWWTLGMDVDVARRRLWGCAMDDRSPAPRAGSIWIFDLTNGARIANHPLAATTRIVDVPNGMTDIVSTPTGLYLLNGQAVRFARNMPPEPFALTRFTASL